MRRQRRQETTELAQRFKKLPPDQAGRVGLVLFGNALVSAPLEIALLVTYVRMLRRLWVKRGHGWRAAMAATRTRPVVLATFLYGGYAVCNRVLLRRWVRLVVERAEQDTKQSEVNDTAEPWS